MFRLIVLFTTFVVILWTVPVFADPITGCINKKGRLVEVQEGKEPLNPCGLTRDEVTWNKKGPKGDKGNKGDKGDRGAPGNSHLKYRWADGKYCTRTSKVKGDNSGDCVLSCPKKYFTYSAACWRQVEENNGVFTRLSEKAIIDFSDHYRCVIPKTHAGNFQVALSITCHKLIN